MRVVLFCHSLISDWNHGNAHFLRGVATELLRRGHDVRVFEPQDSWSLTNLIKEHGEAPVHAFHRAYPHLSSNRYDPAELDLDRVLADVDLVMVHEWNEPALVQRVGEHRKRGGKYRLLFHDTHHRSVTDASAMSAYDLSGYDGVLAFGSVIRDIYLERGWARRAWTWHEAADTMVFHPLIRQELRGDVVWIGNWGDEERTDELREFLIEPVAELGLKATVYGVRYPRRAREMLDRAGIEYAGWIPNYRVPDAFSRYRLTVHVPRRPYTEQLSGIPTIRPFEALACGIPLICSPWEDTEQLFTPEKDYLVARHKEEIKDHMRTLLQQPERAESLVAHGLRTVHARHTCVHRVNELMEICSELALQVPVSAAA